MGLRGGMVWDPSLVSSVLTSRFSRFAASDSGCVEVENGARTTSGQMNSPRSPYLLQAIPDERRQNPAVKPDSASV